MNPRENNPENSNATENVASIPAVSAELPSPVSKVASVDADLINRFHEGDESAFNEIVHRYSGKIYNLAYRVLRNAADAEEIVQDTFIRAHRALIHFRGDAALTTWLSRIALNLSRSRYTYFSRRRQKDSISLEKPLNESTQSTLADCIVSDVLDPVQDTITSEFTRLVAVCMEKLDAPHREILTMRSILDLPYEEIAQLLRLNIGTVKSRVGRARQHLRRLIAEAAPDFGLEAAPTDFLDTSRPSYGTDSISA